MKNRNPLAAYLRGHDITQAEFARRLGAVSGWAVARSQVCRWVAGTNKPSRPWRQLIAQATNGKVPSDVW